MSNNPYDTTSQPQSPKPPKSDAAKHLLWIIPLVMMVPVVLMGGCCATMFFGIIGGLKSADVYTTAVDRVTTNDEVIASLGEPLTVPTFPFQGTIENSSATYSFQVDGPNGSGDVRFDAEYFNNQWEYTRLEVATPQGNVIDLSDEPQVAEASD